MSDSSSFRSITAKNSRMIEKHFNGFYILHSLNPRRPGDLKEAFNTTSLCSDIVNICFLSLLS